MKKTLVSPEWLASTTAKFSPYLIWALVSNFVDFKTRVINGHVAIDLMLEVSNGYTIKDLINSLNLQAPGSVVSHAFSTSPAIRFVSLTTTMNGLKVIALSQIVKRCELAAPFVAPRSVDRSKIARNALSHHKILTQDASIATTLFAVIDDGCPFAHEMLGNATRYRLRALWDQDRHPSFKAKAPLGFGYGAVAKASDLRMHVAAFTDSAGNTNEDRCYRAIGYESVLPRLSHGAHSMGMLLNGTAFSSKADFLQNGAIADSDIVFVQLPRDVMAVPFHGGRLRAMIDGIRWALKQRRAERKVVVVIPYGSMLGPHDGTSLFSAAVDQLIEGAKTKGITLEVILSAGNDFESRSHWQLGSLDAKAQTTITYRLAAETELAMFVEIWLPTRNKFDVSINDPSGQLTSPNSKYCQILRTGWKGLDCELVLVRFAPTAKSFVSNLASPTFSGDWSITVINKSANASSPIHAYASKARGGIGSLNRANQSVFVNLKGKFLGEVSGKGTLSDASCGEYVTPVAGFKGYQNIACAEPADYSSSGPARAGPRSSGLKTMVSIASEESPMLFGWRSTGTRSASTFRMNGTSVAATYFAGKSNSAYPPPPLPSTTSDLDRLGTKYP